MVERCVRNWGFRGIKIHGHEAMPTREVCEAARAFHLPILADVAGRAEVVDMLAPQYPDVVFIIPHLGSFADDWRAHQQVIDQLVRYPNVYTDTSGVRRFDYIIQAIKCAGARKILFGSDGPWLHPGLELYKIRLLKLPQDDEQLILGGNVLRLLRTAGLKRPGMDGQPKLHRNGANGPAVRNAQHFAWDQTERLAPGAPLEREL
jgi:predicted TIM-barrel fold metal-dependent hydrolase